MAVCGIGFVDWKGSNVRLAFRNEGQMYVTGLYHSTQLILAQARLRNPTALILGMWCFCSIPTAYMTKSSFQTKPHSMLPRVSSSLRLLRGEPDHHCPRLSTKLLCPQTKTGHPARSQRLALSRYFFKNTFYSIRTLYGRVEQNCEITTWLILETDLNERQNIFQERQVYSLYEWMRARDVTL